MGHKSEFKKKHYTFFHNVGRGKNAEIWRQVTRVYRNCKRQTEEIVGIVMRCRKIAVGVYLLTLARELTLPRVCGHTHRGIHTNFHTNTRAHTHVISDLIIGSKERGKKWWGERIREAAPLHQNKPRPRGPAHLHRLRDRRDADEIRE